MRTDPFTADARHRLGVYPRRQDNRRGNRLAGTFPDRRGQKTTRTRRHQPSASPRGIPAADPPGAAARTSRPAAHLSKKVHQSPTAAGMPRISARHASRLTRNILAGSRSDRAVCACIEPWLIGFWRPPRAELPVQQPGWALGMPGSPGHSGRLARGCRRRGPGERPRGCGSGPRSRTLLVAVTAPVGPAGRAVARRAARHREDVGVPARVQGPQAGYLDRLCPRRRSARRPRTPDRRVRSLYNPPTAQLPAEPHDTELTWRTCPRSAPLVRAPRSPCPTGRSSRQPRTPAVR